MQYLNLEQEHVLLAVDLVLTCSSVPVAKLFYNLHYETYADLTTSQARQWDMLHHFV